MRDPSSSTLSDRALLLLASIAHDEETGTYVKYIVYQLQTTPNKKGELVLANKSGFGKIPLGDSSTDSVTGIFLSGGSFLFNFLDTGAVDLGKKVFFDILLLSF